MSSNGWRALTDAEKATNPVALNFLPDKSTATWYAIYSQCYTEVLSKSTPSKNKNVAEV